jgi:hypothetical protein
MKRAKNSWQWLLLLCFLLAAGLSGPGAFAQGCASCYTTAAAGGPQTAHALRSGIVLLLIPPVLMFTGIICVMKRWNNS